MDRVVQALPVIDTTGRQVMQTPEDVAQMLRLRACRLGIKSIARKTGRSKNALRRYPERHWTTQHQLNDFIKLLRQPVESAVELGL